MKIDYELKRSARKSISISIGADNKIRVLAPVGMSDRAVQRFVLSKADWISKTVCRNSSIMTDNTDVICYRAVYVKGEKKRLIVGDENETDDDGLRVKNLKQIKDVITKNVSSDFMCLFHKIEQETGLKAAGVSFKGYKARWGCCDGKNNIKFNYKLLMLSQEIWKYVIIHELCHTRYHNHGRNFWNLVAKFCPDYKILVKRLKSFSFIIKLYD